MEEPTSPPSVLYLGTRYILHETGLLIHRETRRIVDANGQHGRNVARLMENNEDSGGFAFSSIIYDTKTLPTMAVNTAYLEESADLLRFVDKVDFYMCSGCERFCMRTVGVASYRDHLHHSPKCKPHEKQPRLVSGGYFTTVDKKNVFIVTETGGIVNMEGGSNSSSPMKMKRKVDVMEEQEKEEGDAQQEGQDQEQLQVKLLSELLVKVQLFVDKKSDSVEDTFEVTYQQKNPAIGSVINQYFLNNPVARAVLPYVLLDCVTEDLWISDRSTDFRFLLRPVPELSIYDIDERMMLKLKINRDVSGGLWSSSISLVSTEGDDDKPMIILDNNKKKKKKIQQHEQQVTKNKHAFKRTDFLEFNRISFEEVCQILIIFRGIAFVLLDSLSKGEILPDGGSFTDFITTCYESVSCAPELAERVIKQQLYYHIGRIDED